MATPAKPGANGRRQGMAATSTKRKWWQRLLGIAATGLPQDPGCWSYADGQVVVDLSRAPELEPESGALRIEGPNLPKRVLVIHGEDGAYYAFCNKCKHGGRRLDPASDPGALQCCSVGQSKYNLDGEVLSGPAKGTLIRFPLECVEGKLIISIT